MIRASSAAAEIHKPLQPQSKAPDVYSKKRECVCDCKCNPIYFHQTCHMNLLCNQRSGCLPPVSKSCVCCSETQNTCLTSCYWVAKTQWCLAWERASVFQAIFRDGETLTSHTSWSTCETWNSDSGDRRKALWRNNMISRVRNHDYKELWRFEQQNT